MVVGWASQSPTQLAEGQADPRSEPSLRVVSKNGLSRRPRAAHEAASLTQSGEQIVSQLIVRTPTLVARERLVRAGVAPTDSTRSVSSGRAAGRLDPAGTVERAQPRRGRVACVRSTT